MLIPLDWLFIVACDHLKVGRSTSQQSRFLIIRDQSCSARDKPMDSMTNSNAESPVIEVSGWQEPCVHQMT